MERRNNLTAAQIVGNLELANKALRNYANELEKKLAKYEHVLARCPRFRAEQESAEELLGHYGEVAPEEPAPRVFTIDYEMDVDDDEDEEDAYLEAQEELEALQDFIETYGVEALEEYEEKPEPRVITIDFEVDVDDDEDEEDAYLEAQEELEALQDFIETYGVEALEEFEEDVVDDDEDDYDEDDEDGEE